MFSIALVLSLLLALALTAVVVAAAARAGQRSVAARAASLVNDDRPALIRARFGAVREQLAEVHAGVEHGLWTLTQVDEQVASTTRTLAEGRAQFDRQRSRLEETRDGVARLRSARNALLRVAELRRTVFE